MVHKETVMTRPMGVTRLRAATPPTSNTRRISSVAYATEDSASDESTASPVTRDRRSCVTMTKWRLS